jgi:hypothetical protein
VRPAPKDYQWQELDKVVRQWAIRNEQAWILLTPVGSIWSCAQRA